MTEKTLDELAAEFAEHEALLDAVLEIGTDSSVGITVAGMERVAGICAEILEGEAPHTPFRLTVNGERFAVYAGGTYHPVVS